jgi:hypothetical protein
MVRRDDDEATRARIGVIGCNPQTVRDVLRATPTAA